MASSGGGDSSCGYLIFCLVDAVTERAKGSLEARFECVCEVRGNDGSTAASSSRAVLSKTVSPVPSTTENHILIELPAPPASSAPSSPGQHSSKGGHALGHLAPPPVEVDVSLYEIADVADGGKKTLAGTAFLSHPHSFVQGVTLDRWIPLNGTRYHFEQRLVPEVEDVAANSKPRLRVLSKYVPGPVAVLESELDRTFHCQDFLILALQSLSATAVGPGTSTSGGGGRGLGTASELDLDMQPEQFGTSTCTSNGAGEGKISMQPMALERVALSTKTNAASVTSSPSLASSTCGAQAVRFGTVAGGPPGSATVPTGAPFLFVSDAGNSSGMSGVFQAAQKKAGTRMAQRAAARSEARNGTASAITSGNISSATSQSGVGGGNNSNAPSSPGKQNGRNPRMSISRKSINSASMSTLPTANGNGPQSTSASKDSQLAALKRQIAEKGFTPLPRGNGGGVVFRSHKEFEDACWERIRPYHQIIDLLESRVETSAFEREDVEIYKKAAAALRVQSVGLQEKFREATTHFERRVAEYAKTVEMKTAEVNSLRGQLHEVRASRDAALDEMTMHKNSLAMDETEKVEQAVLLKQVKSLESLLKEKKDFFQNLEVRRAEEKQTYRENEEKLREQLDGLSAELERVEAEKARTALRLQENLNLTSAERKSFADWRKKEDEYQMKLMTLESENRELRSSKTLLADLRSQVSRQEEQLRTRSQQLEDIRYNFELQQKQEVEQQQRLIHEKQEAVEELRKYQRGGQGGAYNSKPPSPSDILSSSAGAGASGAGRNNPHDASLATHNLRSLEQEISMQTAQRVELEQRLKLAVDAEKHKEQIEKFCKDLEERVAVLVREKEAQEASFAEHLSNEKARVELLEKDNTDLKGLLQEIQPEFHKAQTELEKARFQVKDAEARALINVEQQRLAAKVKEELVDLEQECVALRKSRDHLQQEYVERSSRLWDDYVPKEEARKLMHSSGGPQAPFLHYPHSAPGSTLHGPPSHLQQFLPTPSSIATSSTPHPYNTSTSQSQQNCPPSQYLHSLPNSTNHMQMPDNKDNYRYIPARGDSIDKALAQLINKVRPPVPFYRLSQGIYLYGSKKVLVKLTKQNKLIFRVGGGYCSFHEFLEQFEGGGNSAIVE